MENKGIPRGERSGEVLGDPTGLGVGDLRHHDADAEPWVTGG